MLQPPSLARALSRPASAVAVVPRVFSTSSSSDESLLELSERLRDAGAAAIVLHGSSLEAVRLVLEEQRRAAGNFPGPLPVVYEPLEDDAMS